MLARSGLDCAIQREFVLGSTLSQISIVQPYYDPMYARSAEIPHYTRIKTVLSRQMRTYGPHSVNTKLARLMRVCVTRVRDVTGTSVFDLNVGSKMFWEDTLWNQRNFNLHHSGVSMTEFKRHARELENVIRLGKQCLIRSAISLHVSRNAVVPFVSALFPSNRVSTGEDRLFPYIEKN